MKSKFTNMAATALSALALFATTDARAANVNLSNWAGGNNGNDNYEAQDGDVLTGTPQKSLGVDIAAGATVTFDGVSISRAVYCVHCRGSATIILADGSENTLVCTGERSAINAGGAGTTLTIRGGTAGTGVLNVTGGSWSAAIGGGFYNNYDGNSRTCGNIVIEGGVITAQGGERSAGIGGDCDAICGDITISGGTVTATGGELGAGIGSGGKSSYNTGCGDITISGGTVTATGGPGAAGIGSGGKRQQAGTMSYTTFCGNITIAKTVTKVTATGPTYYITLSSGTTYTFPPDAPIGAGSNGATCGTVTVAPELTKTVTNNDTTWILEGTAPVLSGYAAWASDNSITGAWNEDNNGVYNVFRYVFDVPSGNAGTQITNIVVAGGTAVVMTPAVKNSEGVTVSVVESSDVAGANVTATKPLDAAGTNTFTIGNATSRFYRLSATLTE